MAEVFEWPLIIENHTRHFKNNFYIDVEIQRVFNVHAFDKIAILCSKNALAMH